MSAFSSIPFTAWLTASLTELPALRSSSAAARSRGFSFIDAVSCGGTLRGLASVLRAGGAGLGDSSVAFRDEPPLEH